MRPRHTRTAAALTQLALIPALSGCLGDVPHPIPAAPATAGRAWDTGIRAVEQPVATAGGYAFHTYVPGTGFRVVSLDARTGRVRWRAPASQSAIVTQSIRVLTIDGGRSVVWLRPGRSGTAVSVVAADAVTGRQRWTFGGGAVSLSIEPRSCLDGHAVCLDGYTGPGATSPSRAVLGAGNGALVGREGQQVPAAARPIAPGLWADDARLFGGRGGTAPGWTRPVGDVFGGLPVSARFGWDLSLVDGRYVGSIGYVNKAAAGQRRRGRPFALRLSALDATAAFDEATGRTLWVAEHTGTACGILAFDPRHPVTCKRSGRIEVTPGRPAPVIEDPVTLLTGLDVETGRNTWEWTVAGVNALVDPGPGMVRVDATRYVVQVGADRRLLDLDRGVTGPTTLRTGWCRIRSGVASPLSSEVENAGVGRRGALTWYPCGLDARPLVEPPDAPAFAGPTVSGIFAWQDTQGVVHGSRVR